MAALLAVTVVVAYPFGDGKERSASRAAPANAQPDAPLSRAEFSEALEQELSVPYDPDAGDEWPPPDLPAQPTQSKAPQSVRLPAAHYRTTPTSLPADRYGAERPETYGGLYVDESGRKLVSLWTEGAERHLARLRELSDLPIETRRVRYSLVELDSLVQRLVETRGAFARRGMRITAAGTDVERNLVDLAVDPLTAAGRAWIRNTYGPPVHPREATARAG